MKNCNLLSTQSFVIFKTFEWPNVFNYHVIVITNSNIFSGKVLFIYDLPISVLLYTKLVYDYFKCIEQSCKGADFKNVV